MRRFIPRGIAVRVALACLFVVALAVAIIGTGVLAVARSQFEQLMLKQGATSSEADAMFQQTVSGVFATAVVVAVLLSVIVAVLLARYLTKPLEEVAKAASRLALGDYRARAQEQGPVEIQSLAQAFNAMADSLQRQEQARRDFIAGAAHELLTPLTNLQGYLEGLRDGVVAPNDATFASLQEETERLVRLARALLDLADAPSRIESPERIDLRKAIESTVQLVAPAMDRRHIGIDVIVPDAIAVKAKPDHVTQVLVNLLQNAGRYAQEGGRVIVQVEPWGGITRISVTNTGSVIPAHEVTRIFDRFYRVDKSRDRASGGHGLGLALVKQLVEAGGGEVGADSASGLTTVWFTLPAA